MQRSARSCSRCSVINRLVIRARVSTSSPENASSRISSLRTDGQRASDRQTLALAAAELAGARVQSIRGQADLRQQLDRPQAALRRCPDVLDDHRLGDELEHGEAGVQRRGRVLKNQLNLVAVGEKRTASQARDVVSVDEHPPGIERLETGQAPGQRRLAAPRRSRQAQRAAALHAQLDAGQRLHVMARRGQQPPLPVRLRSSRDLDDGRVA